MNESCLHDFTHSTANVWEAHGGEEGLVDERVQGAVKMAHLHSQELSTPGKHNQCSSYSPRSFGGSLQRP